MLYSMLYSNKTKPVHLAYLGTCLLTSIEPLRFKFMITVFNLTLLDIFGDAYRWGQWGGFDDYLAALGPHCRTGWDKLPHVLWWGALLIL